MNNIQFIVMFIGYIFIIHCLINFSIYIFNIVFNSKNSNIYEELNKIERLKMNNNIFKDNVKGMSLEEMFEDLKDRIVKIKVESNEDGTVYFMEDLENRKLYCVSLKLKGDGRK